MYTMDVISNPDGDTNAVNFITDSCFFKVDVDVSIPLYGKIKGLALVDTIEFQLEKYDEAEYAILHLVTENSFPADIGLQMYFLDEDEEIIDSLLKPYQDIFKAAVVNDNGDVIANTSEYVKLQITKDKLYNLQLAEKVILKGLLQTSNNGETAVRIYSNYDFKVQLGVQTNLYLELCF